MLSADFTPRRKFIQDLAVGAAAVPAAGVLAEPLLAVPSRPIPSARAASAQGAENKDITLQLNRVPSDAKELDFVDGAADAAINRCG